jgi:hypothetical protein
VAAWVCKCVMPGYVWLGRGGEVVSSRRVCHFVLCCRPLAQCCTRSCVFASCANIIAGCRCCACWWWCRSSWYSACCCIVAVGGAAGQSSLLLLSLLAPLCETNTVSGKASRMPDCCQYLHSRGCCQMWALSGYCKLALPFGSFLCDWLKIFAQLCVVPAAV